MDSKTQSNNKRIAKNAFQNVVLEVDSPIYINRDTECFGIDGTI